MTDDRTTAEEVAKGLTSLFGEAKPSTLFSEPIPAGNDLIITASAWERAGGFGYGEGSEGSEDGGEGSGGGGGGYAQGRPVAAIRISESGVEVEPIIDFTKVGVTVLITALAVWRGMSR